MSEESIFQKRVRRTAAEINQILEDFDNSALGREAFCRERHMSKKSLDLYRKRRRQSQEQAGSSERLIPVEVKPNRGTSTSDLTVVLQSGRRIEVKRGFDAGILSQLVGLLERV